MRAERKETIMNATITTLNDLREVLASLPDGATCDVLASDLEAGNFEVAHFENNGQHLEIRYSGPIAEGYISPFETQPVEADL
jgi:hypothetical protein